MALPYGRCFPQHLNNSTLPRPFTMTSIKINSFAANGFKGFASCSKMQSSFLSFKHGAGSPNTLAKVLCIMNLTAGQPDEPGRLNLDHIKDKAQQLWACTPQPIKSFPWKRALKNFVQIILDIALAVIKYLYIPTFAVSCLSEMSYCALERKLYLIPLPLLVGVGLANVLNAAALDSSPTLKNAEVPWHLIANAIFFTLLKLPGPYYPYWGRIIMPHVANGAILSTLLFAFMWYRRPRKLSEKLMPDPVVDSPKESKL